MTVSSGAPTTRPVLLPCLPSTGATPWAVGGGASRPADGRLCVGVHRGRRRPAPVRRRRAGDLVWRAAVALLAAELAVEVGRTVLRDHSMGVDTIALVAMIGSLALGQELAGVVVGLMFSGGAALEDLASMRARRELSALIERAPKVAQLRIGDRIEEVAVEQVMVGDIVVVRTGEVVPVDGSWSAARPCSTPARSPASHCR